jgi:toxin FitB
MTESRYLLDTNTVSELRKNRPSPEVANWFVSIALENYFLSVITLMELVKGMESVRKRDEPFAKLLHAWLNHLRADMFPDRILVVTADIAEEAGRILSLRTRSEADALIAATALTCGLILVTRNTADFEDTGVRMVNPWLE